MKIKGLVLGTALLVGCGGTDERMCIAQAGTWRERIEYGAGRCTDGSMGQLPATENLWQLSDSGELVTKAPGCRLTYRKASADGCSIDTSRECDVAEPRSTIEQTGNIKLADDGMSYSGTFYIVIRFDGGQCNVNAKIMGQLL